MMYRLTVSYTIHKRTSTPEDKSPYDDMIGETLTLAVDIRCSENRFVYVKRLLECHYENGVKEKIRNRIPSDFDKHIKYHGIYLTKGRSNKSIIRFRDKQLAGKLEVSLTPVSVPRITLL